MSFDIGLSELVLAAVLFGNILLMFFVYKNNPKSATNTIFVTLSGVTSIWLVFMYLSSEPYFFQWVRPITRLVIFLAVPQSVLFFLFAYVMPEKTLSIGRNKLVAIIIASCALMALTLSPFVFKDVRIVNNQPVQDVAPGMALFSLFTSAFSIAAVFTLIKKIKHSTGIAREQYKFVFFGMAILLGLIIFTVMIPVMLFAVSTFVPFAPLYVLIFLQTCAYAIIKHHFLDVRLILVRAAAFAAFSVITAGLYAVTVFVVIEKIFKFKIDISVAIGAFIIVLVAALSFQPLYGALRKITKRIFYKDNYDSDLLLQNLTRIMAQVIDLKEMTTTILSMMLKTINVTKGAFLIVKNKGKSELVSIGYPEKMSLMPIESFFRKTNGASGVFVFEDLAEGQLKKNFRTNDISLIIPIMVKRQPVALLILGPKASGEIYTLSDGAFFQIFASEAGIAIQNAQSYEEIKQFSRVLEKRVEERTRELKETQKSELAKAQDIAKLKDEFVFVAAHELRTPVTAIRGFLQMVTPAVKNFPKDVQENLSYIGDASRHLNQLVNDLLEISRSEAGTLKVAVTPMHLAPLIKSLLAEIEPQARERHISITTEMEAADDAALVDEGKIKEVIMNLLSNAVKYNKDGGSMELRLSREGKMLIISVKDTGCGIPKDQQEKIFQKFFRASMKRTEEVLGTGLGLFITRMLVEKMGGKITFASVEGEGSTFFITLPGA